MPVGNRVAALLIGLLSLTSSYASAQAPMTKLSLESYLDMESVSDPRISPDGVRIAYARGWVDRTNDRHESSIWIMDADGGRNRFLVDGELINETVAKSLPWLRHRHMMEFTKIVETQTFPARTTIISRDEHVEKFFMIYKGEVEVVLQDRKQNETIVSRLTPGEFFGEIELMKGGKSIANVRAWADGPVELLTIKREDFKRVMDQSPITAEAVGKIVQERLDAHRAVDSRSSRPFSMFRRKK